MIEITWHKSAMPRAFRHPNALRSARRILGLTQPGLARLVGCSKITIEKFENGTGGISDELLSRIAGELQLNFWQLRENWTPENLVTMKGEPFTRETYQRWKEEQRSAINKTRVDADLTNHRLFDTLLLDVAVKSGKYLAVFATIARRTEEVLREFNLEKEWAAELNHRGLREIPFARHLAFRGADLEDFERQREEFYSKLKQPKTGKSAKKQEPQPL